MAILILAALIVTSLLIPKAGRISARDAAAYLTRGALLIDVRSPGEFNSGHLANAINLPLEEIAIAVPQRVKDKSQVLLLHCASGMRSSLAQKKLSGMGYTNAFNLGSYSRAKNILQQSGKTRP